MMREEPHLARRMFLTAEPFILASGSPRRRELLAALGLTFDVVPSDVEEESRALEPPEAAVQRWAGEKVVAVARCYPGRWVLGADTIVLLGEVIFGKPRDERDAARTLRQLSGQTHEVMSGLCLAHHGRGLFQTRCVTTRVRFKPLSEDEIQAYVQTGEPLDKAGAYGIQGVASCLVQRIEGSYTNVVGLPLSETLEWLLHHGVVIPNAH